MVANLGVDLFIDGFAVYVADYYVHVGSPVLRAALFEQIARGQTALFEHLRFNSLRAGRLLEWLRCLDGLLERVSCFIITYASTLFVNIVYVYYIQY